ncbi:uncharacterized protein [Rutidosis leptorrhynchoides]|uniref:uncharacterized protein n=1 Tax=Rutidosis leptorrhynchoides TaxID=125765 RepID=UPI003A990C29
MDLDFDDLISSDAAINAKASKKFQPLAKPKPKPKPKTLPEPKSVPTPLKQLVEATATANNEPIGRIEEEQIENDVNIHDHRQSSDNKSQEENAESFPASESLNELQHESRMATENASLHSETPNVDVSMDGNLGETGPVERDFINDIDSCTNLESRVQVDPLTGEEATIYNDNLKDPESSSMWESLDIMSESKTRSGTKLGKFKPKPNAQTRKVDQIAKTTTETISEFNVIEDSTNPTEVSQVNLENQAGRSSKRLRKKSNKAFELVDEPDDDITNDAVVLGNEDNNCGPEIEPVSEIESNKSKKLVTEKVKKVRKRKKADEDTGGLNEAPKKKFRHSTKRNRRPVNPEMLKIPEEEREMQMTNFVLMDIIRFREHTERIEKKAASTFTMDPRYSSSA